MLVHRRALSKIVSMRQTLIRFAIYLLLALGLAVTVAASSALAIDLDQFRYATV
jgi:hypothetical protein